MHAANSSCSWSRGITHNLILAAVTTLAVCSVLLPRSAKQAAAAPDIKIDVDQYGGLTSMRSRNPARSGRWRLERFGHKWLFVDPDNNGFYMIGMDLVSPPLGGCSEGGFPALVAAKYDDECGNWLHYSPQLNRRLQAYGWNTIGPYSNNAWSWPVAVHSGWPGDHSQPVKMPFVFMPRAGFYSTYDPNGYLADGQLTLNFAGALSPFYKDYRPQIMPDWPSPHIYSFLDQQLTKNPIYAPMKTSAYKQYLIGFFSDDSDQWYGLAIGRDFPALVGKMHADLAWLVMTSSPQLSGGWANKWVLYSVDGTNYMKKVWHDQLVAKYGTIAALNSAWGSHYTTFDSSGFKVTGELFGTGDGSTLTFTHALNHPPTFSSIYILVNGTVVAGDLGPRSGSGAGAWFASSLNNADLNNSACSIDWSTGLVTLSFSAGHAPGKRAAITVNYTYGAWGAGTGLMDEDGRRSHQGWTGIDWFTLRDTNANLQADLSMLKYNIAHTYFLNYRIHLLASFPDALFFGPDSLTTWGAIPPKEVLRAANGTLDALEMNLWNLTQNKIDFLYANAGDLPVFTAELRHANQDSQLYLAAQQDDGVGFDTQAARGREYYDQTTRYIAWTYPNGSRPFVGQAWWQLNDNTGESSNWGILTFRDNLYNGRDARTAWGIDPWGYRTGGEAHNYGDLLDLVKKAHEYILASLPSQQ